MKNILLVIPYGGVGGMERLAYSFYNYYKKKGYYIKVCKFIKLENDIVNFGEDENFFSDIDFSSMSKMQRYLFYITVPFKLRKIIKNHNITHTISFGAMPNVYSSMTYTKDYKIASIHALKSVELSNNSLLSKMTRFGYKYTYGKLDKVVCISNAIKDDLIKKCNFKFINKLKVIYNPHDLKEIEKQSLEKITSIKEVDLLKTNSILFLGRFSIQKSPWHLIKSFSIVDKNVPNANLIIIGDGDDSVLKHIEKLIKELGIETKVHFLGRRTNPYKYLVKAKVLALSSHYEGTPNVIVEAIALNTPIVSSCCTDGIIELMSIENKVMKNSNIKVDAGIITPNLYKNQLGLPKDNKIIDEEILLAEGLKDILTSEKHKEHLIKTRSLLLDKFNLDRVATEYLS
ncbi:glycosyltransferase involved in cell wall biosynthesis [Cellulophaga sp. RHA19]|uniref:glycosyltransferase n=1 Tax=Cellulophaga sp. RHA19 TaxID=1798237 RepID=UPI000C2CC118|nr:glycosyltransferase [Cellulophaga sp. RHA19]PKB44654.1 glycosyltransferase involved in cell wall biosynthesis [Cellulophaga sp. RHA19]